MNKLTRLLCALSLLCGSLNYCMEKDEKENQERYFDKYATVVCTQLSIENFKRSLLSDDEKKEVDLMFDFERAEKRDNGVVCFKGVSLPPYSDKLLHRFGEKTKKLGFLSCVYLGTVQPVQFKKFVKHLLNDEQREIVKEGLISKEIKIKKERLFRARLDDKPYRSPLNLALFNVIAHVYDTSGRMDTPVIRKHLESLGISYDKHESEIKLIKAEVEKDMVLEESTRYFGEILTAKDALGTSMWDMIDDHIKLNLDRYLKEENQFDIFIKPEVYGKNPDFFESLVPCLSLLSETFFDNVGHYSIKRAPKGSWLGTTPREALLLAFGCVDCDELEKSYERDVIDRQEALKNDFPVPCFPEGYKSDDQPDDENIEQETKDSLFKEPGVEPRNSLEKSVFAKIDQIAEHIFNPPCIDEKPTEDSKTKVVAPDLNEKTSLQNAFLGELILPKDIAENYVDWVKPYGGHFVTTNAYKDNVTLAFLGSYSCNVGTHQKLFDVAASIAGDVVQQYNDRAHTCFFANKPLKNHIDFVVEEAYKTGRYAEAIKEANLSTLNID